VTGEQLAGRRLVERSHFFGCDSDHLVCEKKLSGAVPSSEGSVRGGRSSEAKEARSFALNGLRGFGSGETTRRRLESKRCAREVEVSSSEVAEPRGCSS